MSSTNNSAIILLCITLYALVVACFYQISTDAAYWVSKHKYYNLSTNTSRVIMVPHIQLKRSSAHNKIVQTFIYLTFFHNYGYLEKQRYLNYKALIFFTSIAWKWCIPLISLFLSLFLTAIQHHSSKTCRQCRHGLHVNLSFFKQPSVNRTCRHGVQVN